MQKKSKMSPSLDSDLPDLETRRANLRAIGMPSPYQGESTSSSSLIDSSSSPLTNETVSPPTNEAEESTDNTRESEKAIYEALTSAHQSQLKNKTESHPANETEESSENTTESEKAIYEALTSAHESPPTNETEESNGNTRESEKVIYESLTSVYQSPPKNETESLPANETEESSDNTTESEKAVYEALTSAHQSPPTNETEESSDNTTESEKAIYETLTSAHLSPPTNESGESSDNTRESEKAIYEALTSSHESVHEVIRKKESAGAANVSTDSEAGRDRNKTAAFTDERKTMVAKLAVASQSINISGARNISTVTNVSCDKQYRMSHKDQDIKPCSNISPVKTEQISCALQAPKAVKTVESFKHGDDSKKFPKVTNTEAGKRTKKDTDKEISPQKRSDSATSIQFQKREQEAVGQEIEKAKAYKKMSINVENLNPKSCTIRESPSKRTSIESSKEKGKNVTPTKYKTETSAKEKSRIVTPVKHTREASREKGEKTETPAKCTQDVPPKTATPTKRTPDTPSRDRREKTVSPVKCMTEDSPKVRAKTTTPPKRTSEVPAKEKTKSVTPSKRTSGVPSKEEKKTAMRNKNISDDSSTEKVKITGIPTECMSEVPPKERAKTATVSCTQEVHLKGRTKSMTPTKRKPEFSSNENRARSVTPAKRTPDNFSKAAKIEAETTSKASVREEPKTQSPTKCTPKATCEVRPKASVKNTGEIPYCERVILPAKSILLTKYTQEKPSRDIRDKSGTPEKTTGIDKDFPAKEQYNETLKKHSNVHVLEENETPTCIGIPEKNDSKGNDNTEQKVISFKEFKEALGVDRILTPDVNLDRASRGGESSENPAPNRSLEEKQIRMISTEEFLEALALAVDKLELERTSSNGDKTENRVDPPAVADPRIPHITVEEFRSTLGTEKILPPHNDDLDVFNKALEKLEAKKRKRVTFLIPNEPIPSTSRTRTSPERQLDKSASQNRASASHRNETLCCGTLTFEEFHRGLRTFGILKPELLNFDIFDKALDEMQKNSSSQPTQAAPADSCRPNPLGESGESDSSDEDINSAIAASGLKMKRYRVISSDDEPKTTRQSDIRKMPHSSLSKLEESKPSDPEITNRILEEDLVLSESTSKSSEASPEESSSKSDLVSSESIVKSSESETSPLESVEVSPDQDLESSESAVKSTESEPSPEEFTGIDKAQRESNESEKPSSRYEVRSSVRKGSSESSEESDLRSPKKRLRKDEKLASVVERSVSKQHRIRTLSESDLRKRRPGDHDLIPRKKRYSDEH